MRKQLDPTECKLCKKKFTPRMPWQLYCCNSHRVLAYRKRQGKKPHAGFNRGELRLCQWCEDSYSAYHPMQSYCSVSHKVLAFRKRHG